MEEAGKESSEVPERGHYEDKMKAQKRKKKIKNF